MPHDPKTEIAEILAAGTDMTVATVRPDGAPQATVVSYASEGGRLWFGCGAGSQKAQNLAHDPRVAATVTLPYHDWSQIRGLTLGGHARRITDPEEAARVGVVFMAKFPEIAQFAEGAGPDELALFEIALEHVSILDYRRGFGHTERLELPKA